MSVAADYDCPGIFIYYKIILEGGGGILYPIIIIIELVLFYKILLGNNMFYKLNYYGYC